MRRALFAISLAVLTGCGSSAVKAASPAGSGKPAGSAAPTAAQVATASNGVVSPIVTGPDAIIDGTPLPPVPTIDLHTGNIVRLDWLLPGKKPVLVWFWAPH
jgi:hypothetical protein